MDVVEWSENEQRGGRRRLWWWAAVAVVALGALPFMASQPDAEAGPLAAGASCPGATYTVVANDGWWVIASKLKVTMNALLAANGATTSTLLHPGMVLCVPTGATATTSTTAPSSATTTSTPTTGSTVLIKQFPVQGLCWFTDTYGAPRSGGRKHEGVDIIAKTGQFLYAVDDGTLTKQYIDAPGTLAGNGWRLTRADGTYFFYAHLSAFAAGLKVGSTVKAGQIIGQVGMTGNAGTPHLHFEVHPHGGAAIDPTATVRQVDGCTTTTVPPQPSGAVPSTTTAPPATAPTTTAAPATTAPTTTVAPATTVPAPSTTTPPASTPGTVWKFVAPVKALDTGGRKLTVGTSTTVKVDGLAGVPANTSGVMLRIAARNVSTRGYLAVHPCQSGPNGTSTLTVQPGRANATMTVVPVSAGAFCVTASTPFDVRIDVVGHVAAEGVGVQPIVAKRAMDTRTSAPLAAQATKAASPSALGMPLGSKAVTVTVTLLQPAAAGSIGIGPCGGTPWIVPFTDAPAQVISAIVRTNDGGVCVTPSQQVHVVLDVTGVWTGVKAMLPTAPKRVFDSRQSGAVTPSGRIVAMGVPSGSTRAQYSVTVLAGGQAGALFAWNCLDKKPTASVAYAPAGTTVTVTVTLNATNGGLCLATTASLNVVADVVAAG